CLICFWWSGRESNPRPTCRQTTPLLPFYNNLRCQSLSQLAAGPSLYEFRATYFSTNNANLFIVPEHKYILFILVYPFGIPTVHIDIGGIDSANYNSFFIDQVSTTIMVSQCVYIHIYKKFIPSHQHAFMPINHYIIQASIFLDKSLFDFMPLVNVHDVTSNRNYLVATISFSLGCFLGPEPLNKTIFVPSKSVTTAKRPATDAPRDGPSEYQFPLNPLTSHFSIFSVLSVANLLLFEDMEYQTIPQMNSAVKIKEFF